MQQWKQINHKLFCLFVCFIVLKLGVEEFCAFQCGRPALYSWGLAQNHSFFEQHVWISNIWRKRSCSIYTAWFDLYKCMQTKAHTKPNYGVRKEVPGETEEWWGGEGHLGGKGPDVLVVGTALCPHLGRHCPRVCFIITHLSFMCTRTSLFTDVSFYFLGDLDFMLPLCYGSFCYSVFHFHWFYCILCLFLFYIMLFLFHDMI